MTEPTDASGLKPGDKVRLTGFRVRRPDAGDYGPYVDDKNTNILAVERMPEPLPTRIGAVIEATYVEHPGRTHLVRVYPAGVSNAWVANPFGGVARWVNDKDIRDVMVVRDGWDGTP